MNKIIKKFSIAISFLLKILTINNISKILIIFTIGLITRIFILFYYDVNVFIEYYTCVSLVYYSIFAIFIVVLGEIFTYFDLLVIPSFIFEYYGLVRELFYRFGLGSMSMIQRIFRAIKQVNMNIYHLLCGDYSHSFTIKSITSFLKWLMSGVSNIFGSGGNKLTIGHSEHELSDNKEIKPTEISNVLNKGEDNLLQPKSRNKPSAGTSRNAGEGSSRLHPNSKGKNIETVSNKSKPSLEISEGSRSITFGISGNDSNLGEGLDRETRRSASLRPNIPTPSSVYSPYNPLTMSQQGDFPLYDDSQGSDLNTPSTMPPLFGGSNASGSVRGSTHSIASQRNSDYPAPLNIRQVNQPNIILRRNSVLPEPTFSEIGYSSSAFTKSNASINNRPYDLSANDVLANVTFSRVNPVSSIPLNNVSYNRTLPLIPANIESANQNTSGFDDTQDPCSLNYRSKHKPDFTQVSKEVTIKKPGLRGKVKLVFKSLGSKFTNGVNKIESAYIKYETVSKRHIIWSLFEESKGNYESYQDFKENWDK